MNFCNSLGKIDNIKVQCSLADGYEDLGYIVSRSDIDFAHVTYGGSFTNDQDEQVIVPNTTVTSIALKDSKKGNYVAQLKNAFSGTAVSFNASDYRNTFTNTVSFNIYGNSAEVASIVNGLSNNEFVLILQQKEKGADGSSAYRIFGLENGLVASEVSQDNYSDSVGAGWTITMTEEKASNSALYLFVSNGTDVPTLEATEAAIASMFDQPE